MINEAVHVSGEKYSLAIINGTAVTERGKMRTNIYIRGEKIERITQEVLSADEIIDASGKFVLPGMIDGHVHFMDPSEPQREDFITGTRAAAAGGVTTVIEHTHSSPVRNLDEYEKKLELVKKKSLIDFGLTAHVWDNNHDELGKLWKAGVNMFKMFTATTHGVPGMSNSQILSVLRTISSFGGIVLVHCEDESITAANEKVLKDSGYSGNEVVYLWRSREAELAAINTVSMMASITGAKTIIAHASHVKAIETARKWGRVGSNLYVETCPQYLYLGEDEVLEKGAFRKFTPPARIRSNFEKNAMWDQLNNGNITHVSTDHAPSTIKQKEDNIWGAPFGLPGVETTLSMLLNGVSMGFLSLERVSELTSTLPARIYSMYPKKGFLGIGGDADMVIVDMNAKKEIRREDIFSKAGWSPYEGMTITGIPQTTISRGKVIYSNGKIIGKPGYGIKIPGPGDLRKMNENKNKAGL